MGGMAPRPDIDALVARISADAITICARLAERGHRGWLVGGSVRDLLDGKEPGDWDIATDATPAQVTRTFARVAPTGIAHGTVSVLMNDAAYEVTTLRGEATYSDGRRPDSVVFVKTIEEDLSRRDFTINAIAIDPLARTLIDPWHGIEDLEAHLIRAVGDPVLRFSEDGLRPLRAARFSATLDCEIDPATLAAIEPSLKWNVAGGPAVTVGNVVAGDGNVVCLQVISKSGTTFSIADVATGASAGWPLPFCIRG